MVLDLIDVYQYHSPFFKIQLNISIHNPSFEVYM
jgi:hypothetical protein